MSDPVARLNAALEGRYAIERREWERSCDGRNARPSVSPVGSVLVARGDELVCQGTRRRAHRRTFRGSRGGGEHADPA